MKNPAKTEALTKEGRSRHWMDAIPAEQEIVLCSARGLIDPAAKARVRVLVGRGLNWREAAANATRHRMVPVLCEAIAAFGPDLIPSTADQQILSDALRESAANALELTAELLRLYRLFQAAQIPLIPYKGPVLGALAYGDFGKRDYVDLDFALQQRFIPQAVELLHSAGYRPAFDAQEGHAGRGAFVPGQYSFEPRGRRTHVEIHTERTLRYFPVPLDFQDMESRLIGVEIAGEILRTFSVEDTLVMLCVHGAKHFWERLGWIFDVAKLITVQRVDWALLLQTAVKMKSTRLVLLGLHLAHDLFGASVPESVLQQACKDSNVQELAQKVYEQYAGVSDPSAGVWARAAFRLRSRDGFGQGLRHMLRLVLSPTESDRETVRLPRSLAPLYWLVRPWRLVGEHGLSSKRRRRDEL